MACENALTSEIAEGYVRAMLNIPGTCTWFFYYSCLLIGHIEDIPAIHILY